MVFFSLISVWVIVFMFTTWNYQHQFEQFWKENGRKIHLRNNYPKKIWMFSSFPLYKIDQSLPPVMVGCWAIQLVHSAGGDGTFKRLILNVCFSSSLPGTWRRASIIRISQACGRKTENQALSGKRKQLTQIVWNADAINQNRRKLLHSLNHLDIAIAFCTGKVIEENKDIRI